MKKTGEPQRIGQVERSVHNGVAVWPSAWPSGIVGVSYAPLKLPLAHETHFKNMETIQTNLVTDVRQRVVEV